MPMLTFFVFPSSTNYQMKTYEFGGLGGTSDSTTYSVEGIGGQMDGKGTSTTFGGNAGLIFVQNAHVPQITLTNDSSWYNKLKIVITTNNNATDAKYAIAISTDNFVTTNYVQSDNTVGSVLGIEDYQTYVNWGSGTGENVIGLTPNTTYKVKAKAIQGEYTESAYGPESTAATSAVTLSFDIDVASTDTETAAPYTVALGSVGSSGVTTATNLIWVDFATNADSGGMVYVYDQYAGLRSTNVNYTITSASADLAGATEGFGLRVNSATNLTSQSPYNGATDNVGIVNTTIRPIFSASSAVSGGRGSIYVKAKSSPTTPSASDYTDTLTLISSATF